MCAKPKVLGHELLQAPLEIGKRPFAKQGGPEASYLDSVPLNNEGIMLRNVDPISTLFQCSEQEFA